MQILFQKLSQWHCISFSSLSLPVLQLLIHSFLTVETFLICFWCFRISSTVALYKDKYICKPEILQTTKRNHQIALSLCSPSQGSILKLDRIVHNIQFFSMDSIWCEVFGNVVLWEGIFILHITFTGELNKNDLVEQKWMWKVPFSIMLSRKWQWVDTSMFSYEVYAF